METPKLNQAILRIKITQIFAFKNSFGFPKKASSD
jgi:hypothetical protein